MIGDPARCTFEPRALVGRATPCGTITAQDATVVEKIFAGPRSTTGEFGWYGLTPGTSLAGLARTVTTGGTTTGAPFPIAVTHIGTWLLQNPSWDWTTTTYEGYDQLFVQSVEMYTSTTSFRQDPDTAHRLLGVTTDGVPPQLINR